MTAWSPNAKPAGRSLLSAGTVDPIPCTGIWANALQLYEDDTGPPEEHRYKISSTNLADGTFQPLWEFKPFGWSSEEIQTGGYDGFVGSFENMNAAGVNPTDNKVCLAIHARCISSSVLVRYCKM